jgi:hypothetical protein
MKSYVISLGLGLTIAMTLRLQAVVSQSSLQQPS